MEVVSEIIGPVITGFFAVTGSYFIYLKQAKDTSIDAAKREQRQNDRLEIIEKKIDEHNNYGKKFASCEKNIALMQKDIEYLKDANAKKKKPSK